ncbi:MAG: PKD domain-containing protein [Gammaproteobacteria bacterium]
MLLTVSNVSVPVITENAATISWATNKLADSKVAYDTTTPLGNVTPVDATLVTNHTVTITGLSPSTIYYYRSLSTDSGGGSANGPVLSFTTPAAADTTPPVITSHSISSITTFNAYITWTTDEPTSGQIEYGLDTNYGSLSTYLPTYTLTHGLTLSPLTEGTTYHYRIISQDAAGNTATSPDATFKTNSAPVANAGGPYSGNAGNVVVFDGSASSDVDGDVLTYAWDFGDGSTSIGVNPTHTYTTAGTFTVTLVVNDGELNSAPSTINAVITVPSSMPEDIIWTDLVGVVVEGTTLRKTSSRGWNSGAASTQSIAADGYIEYIADSYNYRMFGLSNTNPDVDYRSVNYGAYTLSDKTLRAWENGTQKFSTNYAIGDTIRVERTGDVIEYKKNGIAFYTSLTTSTGSLIADVSLLNTDSTISNAKISGAGSVPMLNTPPIANAGGPYSGTTAAPIGFDGSASSDTDGDALIYNWDFGDGGSGTGVTPTHTYTTAGSYTVVLTVHDGIAESQASTAIVTVTTPNTAPIAKAGGPYSGTTGTAIGFDGSASSDTDGDALIYNWDFGDGGSGTGVTPTHTYTTAGSYTVVLTVHDGIAESQASTAIVTVTTPNTAPIAKAGGPYSGTTGTAIGFDGSASSDADGDALIYNWDFGDGGTGTGVTPTHTFTTAGTYTVTLSVNDGTVDSPQSTASVIVSDPAGSAPAVPGNFTATVINANQIDLSWTASIDSNPIAGYHLERCEGIGCTVFNRVTDTIITTSYSDIGLKENTSYTYQVRALNSLGATSAYTSTRTATTLSKPTNIATLPLGGTDITGTPLTPLTIGKYSVTPNGAFTYNLPIEVPPGTAGMQPELSLSYNSRGGNGLMGVGWTISGLPIIHRCQATVEQDGYNGAINYDEKDRFCLDGQRLIAINGADGGDGTEYRTEIDQFSRITSHGTTDPNFLPGNPRYFEVTTKSGKTLTFGADANGIMNNSYVSTNIQSFNSNDGNSFYKPSAGTITARAWAVSTVTDRSGNSMSVTYGQDAIKGEHYPLSIDYTSNNPAGLKANQKIEFGYTASRDDPVQQYVRGALVAHNALLSSITTSVGGSLVKEYSIDYLPSHDTGRSIIDRITECNYSDSVNTACKVPLSFKWGNGLATDFYRFAAYSTRIDVSNWNAGPFLVDITGNGLQDLVYDVNGSWHYQLNTGENIGNRYRFDSVVHDTNIPTDNGSRRAVPIDFNNDGRQDLLVSYNSTLQLLQSNGNGFDVVQNVVLNLGQIPLTNYKLKNAKVLDFNGDGRQDLAIPYIFNKSNHQWQVWFNSENGFLNSMDAHGVYDFGAKDYKDTHVIDYNGDGKQELLVPNTLTGNWSIVHYTGDAPYSSFFATIDTKVANTGYKDAMLADINGDGLQDLVYENNGLIVIRVNNGAGFNDFINTGILGDDHGFANNELRALDYNSDGLMDFVAPNYPLSDVAWAVLESTGNNFIVKDISVPGYSYDKSASFPDLNGDGIGDLFMEDGVSNNLITGFLPIEENSIKPDIITEIPNLYAGATKIFYKKVMNKDVSSIYPSNNYPVVEFKTPFHVVDQIDSDDGVSADPYSVHYDYGGLKVNMNGRGLLGFAWRKTTDLETGIWTIEHYRQDYPYIGMLSDSQQYQADGSLLASTENTWDAHALGGTRYSPFIASSTVISNDLDGTQKPTVTSTYQYDVNGNSTQTITTVGGFRTVVDNTYYPVDTANWLLSRLKSTTVTKTIPSDPELPAGSTISTKKTAYTYYEQTGYLKKEYIEPDNVDMPEAGYLMATEYAYNEFGLSADNPSLGLPSKRVMGYTTSLYNLSPDQQIADRTESVIYSSDGRFIENRQNALGHNETLSFDHTTGALRFRTGPNGLTTETRYDEFGRKQLEIHANGVQTQWQYLLYDAQVNVNCPTGLTNSSTYYIVVTRISGSPTSYSCYDRLGRLRREMTQSFDTEWLGNDTEYDHFNRVSQVSIKEKSFDGAINPTNWTVTNYDVLGRIEKVTLPDGVILETFYHGLETTAKRSSTSGDFVAQSKTTTKNALGQVILVTDTYLNSVSYHYDAEEQLLKTKDPYAKSVVMSYDRLGYKVSQTDPDMGYWQYRHNVLGELVWQKDAKGQIAQYEYDQLGRIKKRTEPEGVSEWVYDQGSNAKGKLVTIKGTGGYRQDLSYDHFGRKIAARTTIAGNVYQSNTTYDSNSRVLKRTYPSGFAVNNIYTTLGYLYKVENADPQNLTTYWQLDNVDQAGRSSHITLGNGLSSVFSYDPLNENILSITTGYTQTDSSVQNLSYEYYSSGNLWKRHDNRAAQNLTEEYTYDDLNRLTGATIVGVGSKSYDYDAVGRFINKSDVGTYFYDGQYDAPFNDANCEGGVNYAGPHAVTSILGSLNGTTNPAFCYDKNGNMTKNANRTIHYTSYNKPREIISGTQTVTFDYEPGGNRISQTVAGTITTYVGDYEKVSGAGVEYKHYVNVNGSSIAVYTFQNADINNTRYLHKDHLGSIETITDESGTVVERLSYDAFGKRRQINGQDSQSTILSETPYGFSGQEHLALVGLIHMNGRIYDPALGRFTSADPFVQFKFSTQGYNRYVYVNNNPLIFVDPSGYFLSGLKGFLRDHADILVPLGTIVAGMYCGPPCAAAFSAAATLALGGSVTDAARNGLITFMVGTSFQEIGMSYESGYITNPERIVAHGFVGGMSSMANGGSFGAGFASASISASFQYDYGSTGANAAAAGIVGGITSEISGGDFYNGALISSLGYLFNDAAHELQEKHNQRLREEAYKIVQWAGENFDLEIPSFDNFHVKNLDNICGPNCAGATSNLFPRTIYIDDHFSLNPDGIVAIDQLRITIVHELLHYNTSRIESVWGSIKDSLSTVPGFSNVFQHHQESFDARVRGLIDNCDC